MQSEALAAATTAVVEFRGVSKRYGAHAAVDGVDLAIEPGAFVSILGPSGCGKTTSLRMIAGFEQPSEGRVLIGGADMTGVPAFRRPVNMVFQHYALFPHFDVLGNVAYGLRQRRPAPAADEVARRVGEALELVRLGGYERRRVYELSGGQQQRVALARALVNRPSVLLLDEPLAALDRKLRRDMQIELQNLQRAVGVTFVLVTHDQEEALSMSDRVCVMREGRVVQIGAPRELYDEPADRYVADFVGRSNFFDGVVEAVGAEGVAIRLADGSVTPGRASARAQAQPRVGGPATLAVRPEFVTLARSRDGLPAGVDARGRGRVANRIFLGEHTEHVLDAPGLGALSAITPRRLEAEAGGVRPGEEVWFGWPRAAALALARD